MTRNLIGPLFMLVNRVLLRIFGNGVNKGFEDGVGTITV